MNPCLRHELYYDATDFRSKIGQLPTLERVSELHEQALLERVKGATEQDWNNAVHFQLLSLAYRHSSHKDDLALFNMCRPLYCPPGLLRTLTLSAERSLKSPMPALCLFRTPVVKLFHVMSTSLAPTPALRKVLNSLPKVPGTISATFNQTDDSRLYYHPLAISIETKPFTTVKLEEMKCQVALWGLAQFKKLQSIQSALGREVEYTALPMLGVAGPDCRLFVLANDPDSGESVRSHAVPPAVQPKQSANCCCL